MAKTVVSIVARFSLDREVGGFSALDSLTIGRRMGDDARLFSIAKYGRPPTVDYALFGEGPAMQAHDPDYRVLMEMADKLEKEQG